MPASMSRPIGSKLLALILVAFLATLTPTGCAPRDGLKSPVDTPNPILPRVELGLGSSVIRAELARSPAERERGLMFRKTLADGEGMLFVFEQDQRLSFWMKNTSLPLSLAYLSADGTITQILDLEPYSLEPRSSERSVRYALEVPRGWFERAGAKLGDRVLIPEF